MDTGEHCKMVLKEIRTQNDTHTPMVCSMEITDPVAVQIMIPDPLNLCVCISNLCDVKDHMKSIKDHMIIIL